MTISRMQQQGQMYGLGSLVKSIGKGIKSAVKGVTKVAKSPLGLAAMASFIPFGQSGKSLIQRATPFLFGKQAYPMQNVEGSPGIFGAIKNFFGGEKTLGKTLAMGALGTTAAAALQAAGLDTENPNEMPRDVESLKSYLRTGYLQLNPDAQPDEVDQFVATNTAEYATGGRVGYADGTDEEGILSVRPKEKPKQSPSKEILDLLDRNKEKAYNTLGPKTMFDLIGRHAVKAYRKGEITKAEYDRMIKPFFGEGSERLTEIIDKRQKYLDDVEMGKGYESGGRVGFLGGGDTKYNKMVTEMYIKSGGEKGTGMTIDEFAKEYFPKMAKGGRIGYAAGDVVDQASGIMGLPQRVNEMGVKELDLRETGGFIPPVGVKEKADDIPAMLSNNEFVFTADAVRGMGGGDVNKGAQRLYDQMKTLEKGGRV